MQDPNTLIFSASSVNAPSTSQRLLVIEKNKNTLSPCYLLQPKLISEAVGGDGHLLN